jgi:hypothetical protein
MTDLEEWKQSLRNKITKRNEFIADIKELSDLAAEAEERNKEDEAKLFFVENMPEPILIEAGRPLFIFEKHDEEQQNKYLPDLGDDVAQARRYMNRSGSTSSSGYMELVEVYRAYDSVTLPFKGLVVEVNTEPVQEVYSVFSDLAEEKSKKENLPPRLNKINVQLGDKFEVALQSYEKAKGGLAGVDQSAIQLRDIIEQLWGGIVNLVRNKDPRRYKGVQLNLDANGKRIAVECLAPDDINKQKLTLLLETLYKLKGELSQTEFGKNPLSKDVEQLKDLYSQWLLVISDIANFISSNELL